MSFAYLPAAGLGTLGVVALAGGRPADSAAPSPEIIATTHTLTLEGAY